MDICRVVKWMERERESGGRESKRGRSSKERKGYVK